MTQSAMTQNALEQFEAERTHLRAIAYRMTGSLADAEDVLQEAFLRFEAQDTAQIAAPRAYLVKLVTRLCLDHLKSARVRRETYVGPWLPEPVLDSDSVRVDAHTELASDISVALLLALERLSPLERAAFLLHDVFDVDYSEIAQTLSRSEETCRQLAARARQHVREPRTRYQPQAGELQRVLSAFGQAALTGQTEALRQVLAESAVFYSDGGGRVRSATKPILGRDRIVRFIHGLWRKRPQDVNLRYEPRQVNGLPGILMFQDDTLVRTLAFELEAGQLKAIYSVQNPDKLEALRRVVGVVH